MKKVKLIFSMFAVLLGIGIGNSVVNANAEELNQSGIADRITFATNTLPQGGLSTFTVEFTEKVQNQIKPGDTLTMTFPAGLEGLRNNRQDYVIPLKNPQGLQFATAVVSQGTAVVTFEDPVKNLDNIRGNFTIGFVASNTQKNTDTVFDTNLGLKVTKQKLTVPGIPVPRDDGPRQGPFTHYKVGDMLNGADEVRWFVNINPYEQPASFVDPIVIKDTLGPGQKLNKDSFAISISWRNSSTGREEGRFMTIKEVVDLGWASFKIDEATNSFEVWIEVRTHPELVSGKRVSLQYTSAVTDKSATKMTNDYSIHYRRTNDPAPVDDNGTATVDRVVMGGGADGDGRPLPKPPITPQDVLKADIEEGTEIEEEVKPWEPEEVKPEKGNESTEQDNTHKAEETKKPDILNNGQLIEETLTEEQLEILDDVIQEHIDGHLEDGHTHVIEIDGKPQILTDKEIIEKLLTPDQQKKLKKIIDEHADMSGKKNTPKASEKKDAVKKQETKKSSEKTDDLPETGYKSGMMLSVIGLLVAGLGIYFYKKMK